MKFFPQLPATCPARVIAGMVLCLLVSACGTGIEVTEHVTDKDVRRVMGQIDTRQPAVTLEAYVDSLQADTLHLTGHVLTYRGHTKSGSFLYGDNRRIYIDFDDEQTGLSLQYRIKSRDENHDIFSLPMLIDLDMVNHVARQLVSKEFYIRTPIWYDRQTEHMMDGRRFIKVMIDSVLPGNEVLPLRVLFTAVDSGERAMVWMSDNVSTMHGRDFDALFVANDPHLSYPAISDENWRLITCGQIVVGMTKEECLLSLGTPKHIAERPDQGGLKEYWYYDGGSYLYFVDGLLSQFRK